MRVVVDPGQEAGEEEHGRHAHHLEEGHLGVFEARPLVDHLHHAARQQPEVAAGGANLNRFLLLLQSLFRREKVSILQERATLRLIHFIESASGAQSDNTDSQPMHSFIHFTHLRSIWHKDGGGQIACHPRPEVYDADSHRPRQLFEVAHQPVLETHTYQNVKNTANRWALYEIVQSPSCRYRSVSPGVQE